MVVTLLRAFTLCSSATLVSITTFMVQALLFIYVTVFVLQLVVKFGT